MIYSAKQVNMDLRIIYRQTQANRKVQINRDFDNFYII